MMSEMHFCRALLGIGPIQSLHSTGVEDKDISRKMNVIFVKKHDGSLAQYRHLGISSGAIRPTGDSRIQARIFSKEKPATPIALPRDADGITQYYNFLMVLGFSYAQQSAGYATRIRIV